MTESVRDSESLRQAVPDPEERRQRVGRFLGSEETIGHILVVVSAAVIILVWHLIALRLSPLLLPAPGDVFLRLISYLGGGRAWPHIWITGQEIAGGFALGAAMGIGLGTVAAEFNLARRVIMPYVIISQALPKFALAPMLLIWLGFGMEPKIVIAALISFFPLLENTYLGLTSTPAEMLELFRSLRAPRLTTLRKAKIPHAVPAVFSGLRVALILSVIGAVVGEYVGANKGLGALIIVAQGTLDTELMFVAFILLTSLGLFLDQLHGLVYRLVSRRLYGRVAVEEGPRAGQLSV